jgi:hypothetical protein
MRVIITGDRDFKDYEFIRKKCMDTLIHLREGGYDTSRDNLEIVTTRAKGPERLAVLFANNNDLKIKVFNSVSAGGIYAAYDKNNMMIDYLSQDSQIGVIIAFWKGTGIVVNDLINKARGKKIKIFEIKY